MPYVYSYAERLEKFKDNLSKLTDVQKGYLAGLLDGEGSIGLYYAGNKVGISILVRLTIVTNNDKYLIDYVDNLISKGMDKQFIYKSNDNRKTHVNPGWHIQICHRVFAEAFLEQIYPYLISKKDRAKNLLKFINLRKGRFHTPYSEEELKLVELSKKGNYIMGKAIKKQKLCGACELPLEKGEEFAHEGCAAEIQDMGVINE